MKTTRILAGLLLALSAGLALAQTQNFTRTITTQNLNATGECTPGSCVVFDMASKGGASAEVRGTYTVSGGLLLRRSNTYTTWETISANAFVPVGGTGIASIPSGTQGTWQLGACVGFRWCRIEAGGAVTGTATVDGFTTTAAVGGSTSITGGAGDASAANQVTGNNSLASIDGKLPALSGGRVPMVDLTAVAQGSTTSGQSGTMVQAAVTTAGPSYTNGQTSPLSLDTSGNLRVNVVTGGAGGGNVTGGTAHDAVGTGVNPVLVGGYASAAAPTDVSADGDVVREWRLRNGAGAVQQTFAGTLAATGSGAANGGTQRVIHATDDPLITAVNADPNYTQAPGSAAPSRVLAMGARGGANLVAVTQTTASVPINMSTATTTQLVALASGQVIHVTAWDVVMGGTGNFTLVYGTGTNCGTGTTALTGAYPLIANAGLTKGSGLGPVLVVPAGNALCATNSAAVQASGSVAYTQFTP